MPAAISEMAGLEAPPAPRIVVVLKNALFRFLLRDVLIGRFPEHDVLAAAEAKEVPTFVEGENRLVVLGAEASVGYDLRLLWPIPVLLFSQEDDAALIDVTLAYKCRRQDACAPHPG